MGGSGSCLFGCGGLDLGIDGVGRFEGVLGTYNSAATQGSGFSFCDGIMLLANEAGRNKNHSGKSLCRVF